MHHGEGEHSTDTGPAPPEGFVWGYDSSKSDSAADKDSVKREKPAAARAGDPKMHHGEGEHGMERARDPTMHHGEGEHGMQRARDPEMHHGEGEHSTDTGPAPPEGFVWGYDSSKSDS